MFFVQFLPHEFHVYFEVEKFGNSWITMISQKKVLMIRHNDKAENTDHLILGHDPIFLAVNLS